jgi:hypothetical protein
MDRIFSRKKQADPAAQPTGAIVAPTPPQGQQSSPMPTTAVATPPSTPTQQVDIEEVLEEMAAERGERLNWRTSIVDLMKLVGMESSLAERRELADELGYTGDTSDTATMNIWLHKQVMRRMAENGGKVPANLLD